MEKFAERLYFALEKQISQILTKPISECEKLKQTLFSSKKALAILKRYLSSFFFENSESEIYFFKTIKPQFYSKYIYYVFVYKYFIRKPNSCEEALDRYITTEMNELEMFLAKHQTFNVYLRTGATHLDHIYFTRGAGDIYVEIEDFQGDDLFSTSHDYRLSKLIAIEQYQNFLYQQRQNLMNGDAGHAPCPVTWTGNQSELIELIYALAEAGALNNGNIEIKTAVNYFETMFQIDLKHFYNKFRDITNRKKERAVFLDKLKVSLDRRIESKMQ
nr:RteC domain-containing protein [Pseudopedobacter sp.]